MAKNNDKSPFNLNNLIYFLAIMVAFFIVWQTTLVILDNYALQKKVDDLKNKIAVLELENQRLAFNNEYYKTDSYLDLAAREKFSKRTSGEKVIYVPRYEAQDNAASTSPDDKTDTVDKSQRQKNVEQWLYFLFGRQPS